uniref:YadA-like family protein n=1 Tax=Acinetobacter sp. CFCC 10889 TaxID=1775557 RepID=UPI000DCFEA35
VSNIADAKDSKDATSLGQVQDLISKSSNVEIVDKDGNKQNINVSNIVVNKNQDNTNLASDFLTYNKAGQNVTDRLTIAETVQKMNTEGIKFVHTNAKDQSGSLGITNDSSAGADDSTAIGVNAIVEQGANSTIALGHSTTATSTATDSVVIGRDSLVQGISSIAIGHGAQALGTQSISIGTKNIVRGNHSGAIGDPTIVDGDNSYSVGNNNTVKTDNTFVLGNDITQTVEGSVVLGNKSAATTGADVAGYNLAQATDADRDAIAKTTSTTGAVAVGDANNGIFRQITGVAAGTADSDAVNVAQLKAVDNQVTKTQNSLVEGLGGGAKVNQDGTITSPTYNVTGGTQNNVGAALNALDKAIADTTSTANAGWTVKAGTTSQTIKPNATVEFAGDNNITVKQTNDKDGNAKLAVELNKDLEVNQIKAGETLVKSDGISVGQVVQLGGTGLVIQNGPSITTAGINAGNKVISNVANGSAATDAVNKGQLDAAVNDLNKTIDNKIENSASAVQYDKNADGTINKDKVTLAGTNGTTITNVADGNVEKGSTDAINGNQLANVRDDLQGQINTNTQDISNIKNEINNGSLGLVQQTGGSKADITVGKNTGGTTVNMAGKDGDRVVTGVANGAVNKDSKDAVNGSQLHAQKVETNQKIVEYLGGGAAIDNITGSFTKAPTYQVDGKDYSSVGGAVEALNKVDQQLGSKIDNVSNRLEQAFQTTNQRIDDVEKRANAGIAAALAMEAAPYVPGKYTYAAGAAYHGGENAVGVTLRKTADSGRWSLTGGIAAASEGDPSVRIGISGVID